MSEEEVTGFSDYSKEEKDYSADSDSSDSGSEDEDDVAAPAKFDYSFSDDVPLSNLVNQRKWEPVAGDRNNFVLTPSYTAEDALIADYKREEESKDKIIRDKHYTKALAEVTKMFRPPIKYRPVSFPDLRYYPWTLPTSAEAPYTNDSYWKADVKKIRSRKNKLTMEDFHFITYMYNEIFIHNRTNVHRIEDGIYTDIHGNDLKYHNQAHARSHFVKAEGDDKIRMVFGVPKLLIQVETMFLWPLVNDLVNRDGPMLWGYETLKGGWYKMYQYMSDLPTPQTYLALDWKQFDKRAEFGVIDDLHDIESYIDFENGYMPTIDYPETYIDPQRLHSHTYFSTGCAMRSSIHQTSYPTESYTNVNTQA
ncbi:unnamed protein product [Ceutorhynchus assimilis]|uniref:Uncharacterized protein n=1 Tax=Ceutorhynchus assimilis TaxID=467358 RepID=A0A9N9QHV1_9CUCU|nr:unnamed protein product [Ceutorhynchus assimilis]